MKALEIVNLMVDGLVYVTAELTLACLSAIFWVKFSNKIKYLNLHFMTNRY